MTDLERDLRAVLNKYNMQIHEIYIILANNKSILEIVFEDIEESYGTI